MSRYTGPEIVITTATGRISHPLPDDPATVARVVTNLAPHIPVPATWQVRL